VTKFSSLCNLDNIYVVPEGNFQFGIFVFFSTDRDIEDCREIGIRQSIQDVSFDEITRVGLGRRDEVTVAFEFDSDENVQKKYEGNYWFRLR